MRKSLGDKRREIPLDRAQDIVKILGTFEEGEDGDTRKITKDGKEEEASVSRIYPTTHFGFRKITVERPLRLSFQATPERIARLDDEKRFQALAQSKKKGAAAAKQQAEGRAMPEKIRELLRGLPDTSVKDREEFERMLDAALEKAALQLSAPARKAILSALSERDEDAAICRDEDGSPEPDPELRDTESVPLPAGDDPVDAEGLPASVRAFFETPRPRRLDRHRKARRERRPCRPGGLRDQFQPLLLPLHAAAAARGDRSRHPRYRDRHRTNAGGGYRVQLGVTQNVGTDYTDADILC